MRLTLVHAECSATLQVVCSARCRKFILWQLCIFSAKPLVLCYVSSLSFITERVSLQYSSFFAVLQWPLCSQNLSHDNIEFLSIHIRWARWCLSDGFKSRITECRQSRNVVTIICAMLRPPILSLMTAQQIRRNLQELKDGTKIRVYFIFLRFTFYDSSNTDNIALIIKSYKNPFRWFV